MSPEGVRLAMSGLSAPLSLKRSGVRARFHQPSTFDVSTYSIYANHITLTRPHLAPPVPKARPADTQSVNTYQCRYMPRRCQVLPNCTAISARRLASTCLRYLMITFLVMVAIWQNHLHQYSLCQPPGSDDLRLHTGRMPLCTALDLGTSDHIFICGSS
jgi:hypothetical protein